MKLLFSACLLVCLVFSIQATEIPINSKRPSLQEQQIYLVEQSYYDSNTHTAAGYSAPHRYKENKNGDWNRKRKRNSSHTHNSVRIYIDRSRTLAKTFIQEFKFFKVIKQDKTYFNLQMISNERIDAIKSYLMHNNIGRCFDDKQGQTYISVSNQIDKFIAYFYDQKLLPEDVLQYLFQIVDDFEFRSDMYSNTLIHILNKLMENIVRSEQPGIPKIRPSLENIKGSEKRSNTLDKEEILPQIYLGQVYENLKHIQDKTKYQNIVTEIILEIQSKLENMHYFWSTPQINDLQTICYKLAKKITDSTMENYSRIKQLQAEYALVLSSFSDKGYNFQKNIKKFSFLYYKRLPMNRQPPVQGDVY